MGIGIGAAIPGVSGAAIAVMLKVYEDIINAVNDFRKHFGYSIKVLIPILLGIIIAVIPCIILFKLAFQYLMFVLICMFCGFLVGSLSMVGIPLFSGFISKLQFMDAASSLNYNKMLPSLIVLGISTILNAIYFMKTVIRIYTPADKMGANRAQADMRTTTVYTDRIGINGVVEEKDRITFAQNKLYGVTIILFVILNVALGLCSNYVIEFIKMGLGMFAKCI